MKNNNQFLPMGYKIRLAEISDVREIVFVHAETWKTTYEGIIDQAFLESLDSEDRLIARKSRLLDKTRYCFVVVYQNQIIGFCESGPVIFHENRTLWKEQWKQYENFGEIYTLYILKEHQKKGIGQALFYQAKIKLKEQGYMSFLVWVIEENKTACQFYEKNNGIKVDETLMRIGNKNYQGILYKFDNKGHENAL